MKCKVCGSESGKYPLCKACNFKKGQGLIVKCDLCGQWHYTDSECPTEPKISNDGFLYEPKESLISKSEQSYFEAIKASLPENYYVFPQINLAAFIYKSGDSQYRNELFRNVDFLITDSNFSPKIVIEINDPSHLSNDRRKRDEKVKKILEEAGIPLMKLWTSYGVNPKYIKERITEILNSNVIRIHHFELKTVQNEPTSQHEPDSQLQEHTTSKPKHGCYVATCVYGSYDCPQVWTLRRFRDYGLSTSWHGKIFIKIYYAISPTVVKLFGKSITFRKFWKKILDRFVHRLNAAGYDDNPYED